VPPDSNHGFSSSSLKIAAEILSICLVIRD
jgi:hypothetical protein